MRKIVKGSNRELVATLWVDWHGHGNLFFSMTKKQVRNALVREQAKMTQKSIYDGSDVVSYPVRRFPSGSLAIGCEHFNKEEVAELKKWAGTKGTR